MAAVVGKGKRLKWVTKFNRSSIYYKAQTPSLSMGQLNLLQLVDKVYTQYHFFGTRQMAQYLNQEGHKEIKRHHTRWAYETLGLQSVAPGPHTNQTHLEHKVYPYLLNDVEITAINQVWSTDLTYIRLKRGSLRKATLMKDIKRSINI